MIVNTKIIISGSLAEIFHYSKGLEVNSMKPKKTQFSNPSVALRRLIAANVGQWMSVEWLEFYKSFFVTLTFSENLQSLDLANRHFKNFILRIKRLWKFDPAYVAIPEFQKRGAVHYHVIFFNLPFKTDFTRQMDETWGFGFVQVKVVSDFSSAAWYVAKYLSKNQKDERFNGRKNYFSSRNLLRPQVSYDLNFIMDFLSAMYETSFVGESSYISDYTGHTRYQVYDISDHPIRFAYSTLRPRENFANEEDFLEVADNYIQQELF